ncbi:hypothetical protein EVJ58_g1869 [Rhodofomes roseus]|uniref:Cytosolic endo-beta-N-acetylglucosaminidase TIM barrel domain-containing protein n=1 Tax=Rhodofomes roseus TaxID=34475 RepID=A0A4Y9Z0Y5_9APHY|nr:hypothetical protein EVJ58_g1869 [Rhodofomes roseus]
MPLSGKNYLEDPRGDAPYFRTLADLDEWASKHHNKLDGLLPYVKRRSATDATVQSRGRLLVCHDYKGGYTETPSGLAYTFNFWSYCDTFIRIFEHDAGQQDCLRLLVGRLPKSKTGSAAPSADNSLPLSPHYAKVLADLAYQRGFDGYLLNVEVPLIGRVEQSRALAAWIGILESELKRKVGSHAHTIWYDSVVVTGDLRWQDRLNNYNLPFFLPSSGFFTNYTWRPDYPSLTAQYFFSLEPSLMCIPKRLQDIYVGIDVWGRGQHGGGGFGSYRSLAHIDPEFLGLSVALFGPGWSWETEQDKPGFSWETWWAYERKLWLGPQTRGEAVEVPPHKPRAGEPDCEHGEFTPITAFFPRQAPPNPRELPFLTYFSPGVGYAWFVDGAQLYQTKAGWTDLDKTTSLGDLVWPRPELQWADNKGELPLPAASTSLSMTDAWLGGSSLQVVLSLPAQEHEDAASRCVWIPVQTLAFTPNVSYTVNLVYKVAPNSLPDLEVAPSVRTLGDSPPVSFDIKQKTPQSSGLQRGWSTFSIDVILSAAIDVEILLGLMSVLPTPLTQAPSVHAHQPKILWADYALQPNRVADAQFSGTLSWEIAASLGPMTSTALSGDPEDPRPLWTLNGTFPSFAFFNVYVQAYPSAGSIGSPESAIWIGTTGLDGRRNALRIDPACLPSTVSAAKTVRFYVQGVTDRGTVLTWDNCVFVDVTSG